MSKMSKEKMDMAMALYDKVLARLAPVLVKIAVGLTDDGCDEVTDILLLVTASDRNSIDGAKITAAAFKGCNCKDCLLSALKAVANSFGVPSEFVQDGPSASICTMVH